MGVPNKSPSFSYMCKYGTFTSQFNMSIVPWASGKLLVWDATCSDTFAVSNILVAGTKAGALAEKAEQLKMSKYSRHQKIVPVP